MDEFWSVLKEKISYYLSIRKVSILVVAIILSRPDFGWGFLSSLSLDDMKEGAADLFEGLKLEAVFVYAALVFVVCPIINSFIFKFFANAFFRFSKKYLESRRLKLSDDLEDIPPSENEIEVLKRHAVYSKFKIYKRNKKCADMLSLTLLAIIILVYVHEVLNACFYLSLVHYIFFVYLNARSSFLDYALNVIPYDIAREYQVYLYEISLSKGKDIS